ncbi:MAG: hypothetical protein ACYTG0_33320 [Planctomycetota bacterium]|jgi:hypothetical protein
MQLAEFIEESLVQMIQGVKKAQDKTRDTDAEIAPAGLAKFADDQTQIMFKPGQGLVNMVEYDVAVTTGEKTSAQGGIGIVMAVLGVGAQAKMEDSSSAIHRIKFSIPVVLGPGEE